MPRHQSALLKQKRSQMNLCEVKKRKDYNIQFLYMLPSKNRQLFYYKYDMGENAYMIQRGVTPPSHTSFFLKSGSLFVNINSNVSFVRKFGAKFVRWQGFGYPLQSTKPTDFKVLCMKSTVKKNVTKSCIKQISPWYDPSPKLAFPHVSPADTGCPASRNWRWTGRC